MFPIVISCRGVVYVVYSAEELAELRESLK